MGVAGQSTANWDSGVGEPGSLSLLVFGLMLGCRCRRFAKSTFVMKT
jgi:hypothetical protein